MYIEAPTLMGTIEFTNNLSTNLGFQFKFFCNRCHDGYLSTLQDNPLGMAGSLIKEQATCWAACSTG